jgi:hypothetical protein
MAEETPEQRFERLQNAVQSEILTAYPNPTRNGCPGDVVVKRVAARRELIKDAPWEHITHCSPCYGEFLSYKQGFRSAAKKQKRLLRIQWVAAACLLAILLVALRFWSVRGPEVVFDAELDLRHALLVFRDIPSAQSESTTPLNPPLTLRRGHMRLKIDLPETWEPGKYDVAFLSGASKQNVFTTTGDAKLSEDSLVLSIDARLNVRPGDYTISLRREGSAWKGYPVRVTNEK